MALIASGSGEDKGYEEVPIGAHKAICYKLIDGGTAEEEYQGEVSIRHKISRNTLFLCILAAICTRMSLAGATARLASRSWLRST